MGKAIQVLIVMAAMSAGLFTPRPVFASSAISARIDQAAFALAKGDPEQAAKLADTVLSQERPDPRERALLLLYRGVARELLGDHDAAMHDLDRALDGRALPTDERSQALLQRGFLREERGRLDEAVTDYGAAIALKDYNAADALNHRAGIFLRQAKFADARRDYQTALSADGGHRPESYFGLGQIAEQEHDRLAALSLYAKAAAIDPDYTPAVERLKVMEEPAVPAVTEKGDPGPQAPAVPRSVRHERQRADEASRFASAKDLSLRPALDQTGSSISGSGRESDEIQIGAWRSAAKAEAGWEEAKALAGPVLEGLHPQVVAADLPGKGRYFRLRVRAMTSDGAAQTCAGLTAKGVRCVLVRR